MAVVKEARQHPIYPDCVVCKQPIVGEAKITTPYGSVHAAGCHTHLLRQKEVRTFMTGATRDKEGEKHDYEGFLSPTVIRAFGRYMHKHRKQSDGKIRASDNWQKGIPMDAYMKSMFRHFMDVWELRRTDIDFIRDFDGNDVYLEDALCALMFNVMGMLHEHLKAEDQKELMGDD